MALRMRTQPLGLVLPIPIGKAAIARRELPKDFDAAELKLAHLLWSRASFFPDPTLQVVRAGDQGPPPFAVQEFDLPSGRHELAAWLPGPHPHGAAWWKTMSVWVLLRKVA
jgi:hypothetical protein